MAKRKKKGGRPTAKASAPKPPASALAQQLSAWREDRAPAPEPEPTPPPRESKPDPRDVTPEQLMAEAFGAVSQGAHAAKFTGRGYDPGDVEVRSERPKKKAGASSGRAAAPANEASADDLLFFELMAGGDVQSLKGTDKVQSLREKEWAGIHWHDTVQLSRMTAEELHEPQITGTERELLKRSRRAGAMSVVNVRRLTEREAIGEVEAAIHESRRQGRRFVRVVTGKGKRSKGEPVLKPAVIGWAEGEGARWVRAWAPETDLSGRYGSVVLELKAR